MLICIQLFWNIFRNYEKKCSNVCNCILRSCDYCYVLSWGKSVNISSRVQSNICSVYWGLGKQIWQMCCPPSQLMCLTSCVGTWVLLWSPGPSVTRRVVSIKYKFIILRLYSSKEDDWHWVPNVCCK